jgi:hypothetical protein
MTLKVTVTQTITQLDVTQVRKALIIISPFDVAGTAIPKSVGTAAGDIISFSAAGVPVRVAKGANGQVIGYVGGMPAPLDVAAGGSEFIAQAGDGTFVPSVGVVTHFRAHRALTIKKVTVLGYGAASGSCVFDIRKDTYANYSNTEPSSGDSVCASTKPSISAGIKAEDATLTSWIKTIAAGDIYRIFLESISSFTMAVLIIEFE